MKYREDDSTNIVKMTWGENTAEGGRGRGAWRATTQARPPPAAAAPVLCILGKVTTPASTFLLRGTGHQVSEREESPHGGVQGFQQLFRAWLRTDSSQVPGCRHSCQVKLQSESAREREIESTWSSQVTAPVPCSSQSENNSCAAMSSGSEEGSYLRLIDVRINQIYAGK